MRKHETWCASSFDGAGAPMPCDCGAQQENAQQLAPYNPMLKKSERREKQPMRGLLPEQFCLKCEGTMVKRAVIVPLNKAQPERHFAACLDPECAFIREIEHTP